MRRSTTFSGANQQGALIVDRRTLRCEDSAVKATVLVRLKGEVLDPQGDAVRRALGTLGFEGVKDVRIGKLVEIEIEGAASVDAQKADALKARLAEMADAILANPVIEDFEVRVG
jgi:phosphoribosylformylglycinamidine synthase subunit PurS